MGTFIKFNMPYRVARRAYTRGGKYRRLTSSLGKRGYPYRAFRRGRGRFVARRLFASARSPTNIRVAAKAATLARSLRLAYLTSIGLTSSAAVAGIGAYGGYRLYKRLTR